MTNKHKKDDTTTNPLELYACGNRIRSTIIIKNPGDEILRLRSINITETNLCDVAGKTLEQIPFSARLHPGQALECPLKFEVDPTTPPDTYKGKFEYGEILQQPFILHILKGIELYILPSPIIARGLPGQRLTEEILVSNKSNVPINLDQEMIMRLYEVDEFYQILKTCLDEVADDGFINVLNNFVVKLKEGISEPMSIKFESEDLELRANETRKFNISLNIPDNLKSNSSYRGKISIYNCQLSLSLHCI